MSEEQSPGQNLTLDQLREAFPGTPRPEGFVEQPPNRYRGQNITVKTDSHDVDGEVTEETLPFHMAGLIAAFQRLISIEDSEKSERMKTLETLMWETITQDWGFSKWHWRSRWYVIGFDPPEVDD